MDLSALRTNQAPSDFDSLSTRANALADTANQWLRSVPEITDEETAQACDSYLSQVRAEIKAAEETRKLLNGPHDKAIKLNNERFRPLTALLTKCEEMLKPLKARWLVREGERIAQERREREAAALAALQAAEDAKAKAGASVQDALAAEEAEVAAQAAMDASAAADRAKAQVKGDLSARSSGLRTYWFAQITDWGKAAAHYADDPKVRETIQLLANADARQHKQGLSIPGIQAKSEQRV